MYGWMDGWIDGCMDVCMYASIHPFIHPSIHYIRISENKSRILVHMLIHQPVFLFEKKTYSYCALYWWRFFLWGCYNFINQNSTLNDCSAASRECLRHRQNGWQNLRRVKDLLKHIMCFWSACFLSGGKCPHRDEAEMHTFTKRTQLPNISWLNFPMISWPSRGIPNFKAGSYLSNPRRQQGRPSSPSLSERGALEMPCTTESTGCVPPAAISVKGGESQNEK
jgi:hypothetical protein